MLLSLAQFGREITVERIRDKIASSKKKGMWIGDVPTKGCSHSTLRRRPYLP